MATPAPIPSPTGTDTGTPSVNVGSHTVTITTPTTTVPSGNTSTAVVAPVEITTGGVAQNAQVQSLLDILAQEYANGGQLIGQNTSGVVALPTQIAPTSQPKSGLSNSAVMILFLLIVAGVIYYLRHRKKSAPAAA